MALDQLVHRLLGISAICLAALLVPLTPVQRVLVLTAFGLGIGTASVRPAYDRSAARLVGPAVLALALLPASGLWAGLALLATAVVGFACFDQAGMNRAVPALGLPIMTFMFRSGNGAHETLVLAWVVTLIVTIVWGSRVGAGSEGLGLNPRSSEEQGRRTTLGRRRLVQSSGVMAVIVAVSVVAAGPLDRLWPDDLAVPVDPGDRSEPAQEAHPGLTGGLDAGAPVSLSDDVVLRVRSDRPLYWRGTTYTDWDGRTWTGDVDTVDVSWPGDGLDLRSLNRAGDADPELASIGLPAPVTVTQHFRTERAGLDVLLGAWRMDTLWTSERRAEIGDDGSVVPERPLGSGAAWTVESEIVPADADDLRRADPDLLADDHPIVQHYGVEDDVEPAVAELARTITAGAPTTYDKIRALEQWMDANLVYTRAIEQLPSGSDAVEHLLFNSRRGFCEQIGSALVVMLRSIGVPARLVVGFVPGEYEATTGEWLSRGTDAHAWAEVYFPGVGWQGFDPTAGVPLAATEPPTQLIAGRTLGVALAIGGLVGVALLTVARVRASRGRLGRDAGVHALSPLQHRLDHCGRLLDRSWTGAMTLREKGDDLMVVGVDRATVEPVVSALEAALFFAVDSPSYAGGELEEIEAAVAALEREVEVLRTGVAVR